MDPEVVKLRLGFGTESDHALRSGRFARAACMRSALVFSRSRTGSNGMSRPASIWALLRLSDSTHSSGAGV